MRYYWQVTAGILLIAAFVAGTLLPVVTLAADQSATGPADQTQPPTNTSKTQQDSLSSLPDKYIVEMEKFYAYCNDDDYLSKNFDCRCLSVEYIDTRTAKGPDLSSAEILKEMKKESCRYDKDKTPPPASTSSTPATPEQDYSNLPDEYLKETNDFFENCNATYELSTNYDCECMSTKFLDMRIKNGPDMPESQIMMHLSTECPNVEGVANHIYTQCAAQGPLLPLNQSVEDHCTCVANTFAKLYKDARISAGSQEYTSLRSSAMLMCTELPGGIKFPNLAYPPKVGP